MPELGEGIWNVPTNGSSSPGELVRVIHLKLLVAEKRILQAPKNHHQIVSWWRDPQEPSRLDINKVQKRRDEGMYILCIYPERTTFTFSNKNRIRWDGRKTHQIDYDYLHLSFPNSQVCTRTGP